MDKVGLKYTERLKYLEGQTFKVKLIDQKKQMCKLKQIYLLRHMYKVRHGETYFKGKTDKPLDRDV